MRKPCPRSAKASSKVLPPRVFRTMSAWTRITGIMYHHLRPCAASSHALSTISRRSSHQNVRCSMPWPPPSGQIRHDLQHPVISFRPHLLTDKLELAEHAKHKLEQVDPIAILVKKNASRSTGHRSSLYMRLSRQDHVSLMLSELCMHDVARPSTCYVTQSYSYCRFALFSSLFFLYDEES